MCAAEYPSDIAPTLCVPSLACRLTLLGRGKKLRLPSACRLMASSCQGRAPSQGQHGLVATSAAGYLGTGKAGCLAWRLAPASGSSYRALAPLASTSRSASLQQRAARTLGLGGAGSRAMALLASSSSSSGSASSFATVNAKLCCSHRLLGWLSRGPFHVAPLSAGGGAANSTVAADAASVISTQASTLLSSVQEGATHQAMWTQLQAAVQAVHQSGAAGQGDEGLGRALASALAAQADDSIDGMTGLGPRVISAWEWGRQVAAALRLKWESVMLLMLADGVGSVLLRPSVCVHRPCLPFLQPLSHSVFRRYLRAPAVSAKLVVRLLGACRRRCGNPNHGGGLGSRTEALGESACGKTGQRTG